ncbi:glycosyltransferase family 2 protein [Qipengyuania flava]|uniref:glycosyltransferase family 2 protein n=1 Tax=Qipengyuania flava TaxID=192812 RepID=UPI001CFF0149|nr:hypothetical protein [Qipengyuania flava]
MADICIIAVTFDRPRSFARLFESLLRADYGGRSVDFLVSIDGGPRSEGTQATIGPLHWPHGKCGIRRMPENYGLRRHILHCGDESANYDAVILLEDDIVVGPGFFRYASWASRRYSDDERVAGISLYSPAFNEMAALPFVPAPSSHPVYALQSAQSWGQCWTKAMWAGFRKWYDANAGTLENAADMPDRIYSWPESSWKKYAMKYLAETGRTWVYPFTSHSTNCSEVGTHNRQQTALFQVPLAADWNESAVAPLEELTHYDIYFERENAPLAAEIASRVTGPFQLDLYGTRQKITGPANLLTVRHLPIEPVARFGLNFRPHEINAALATPGADASLYQIAEGETVDLRVYRQSNVIRYHSNLDWRESLTAGWRGFVGAVRRRFGQ